MKYIKYFERLGFPDYFKFGIEIEADNVNTKGKDGLYTGQSAELVPPILSDSKQDW